MERQAVRLTRKELYEKMWSRPAIALAEEFGISGRGLGKICSRFEIPVPPRGYWAKLAAGRHVTRIPLPTAKSDVPSEILIQQSPESPAAPLQEQVRAKITAVLENPRPDSSSRNAPQPAPDCQTLARAETRAPEGRPTAWPEE